jgi:hypothetical protein
MATSGTITGKFTTTNRHWKVTITGMTSGTNTLAFDGRGYQNSSYVVSGVAGAAFSGQFQGSNDGGLIWVNIGSAVISLPAGGTVTPNGVNYGHYQFVITGGDATTNVAVRVDFSSNNAS